MIQLSGCLLLIQHQLQQMRRIHVFAFTSVKKGTLWIKCFVRSLTKNSRMGRSFSRTKAFGMCTSGPSRITTTTKVKGMPWWCQPRSIHHWKVSQTSIKWLRGSNTSTSLSTFIEFNPEQRLTITKSIIKLTDSTESSNLVKGRSDAEAQTMSPCFMITAGTVPWPITTYRST